MIPTMYDWYDSHCEYDYQYHSYYYIILYQQNDQYIPTNIYHSLRIAPVLSPLTLVKLPWQSHGWRLPQQQRALFGGLRGRQKLTPKGGVLVLALGRGMASGSVVCWGCFFGPKKRTVRKHQDYRTTGLGFRVLPLIRRDSRVEISGFTN